MIQIRGKRRMKTQKQRAFRGAGRSKRSCKAKKELLCFQKRLGVADYSLFLFSTMDVEQLSEPYSVCNQKYQLTFSSIQKISFTASAVN